MIIHIALFSIVFILANLTGFIGFHIAFLIIFAFYVIELFAVFTAPYVPTVGKDVKTMARLANISKGSKVYDLGAGDGVLVNEAAKRGADAIGYELSVGAYAFYLFKKIFFRQKGVVIWGNFWKKDTSDADVVFCYLMPHAMKKVEKTKFPKMKKGARLVSRSFKMPNIKPKKVEGKIYLYIKE